MRSYTSVSAFSVEFGAIFSDAIGLPVAVDAAEVQAHISNEVSSKDTTPEYKETKKLAKRIIKAVQASLEDALRKESELYRRPFEKELRGLGLLENSVLLRRDSIANSLGDEMSDIQPDNPNSRNRGSNSDESSQPNSLNAMTDQNSGIPKFEQASENVSQVLASNIYAGSSFQQEPSRLDIGPPVDIDTDGRPTNETASGYHAPPEGLTDTNSKNSNCNEGREHGKPIVGSFINQEGKTSHQAEPPSPLLSSEGDSQMFNGGIPWYMAVFDPVGTTIQEERWTGRELVRGMSEELTDMDEEELSGLVDTEIPETQLMTAEERRESSVGGNIHRKNGVKRKRWRGFR